MTKMTRLKELLADIAAGKLIPTRKTLDWKGRSLRLNGHELSQHLKYESFWDYLAALALAKPKVSWMARREDGVIADNQLINGHAKAGNLRREIGRALPRGVAALFIRPVRGLGHKLAHDVHVRGSGEATLKFSENANQFVAVDNQSASDHDPDSEEEI